jgi:protein-L-isoaspartate O-methyltransferase
MPVSDYHQISDVLHVVQQVNPKTVLDVGVGFGKWGVLCREVLDIYQGRVSPPEWLVRIDGIEIHEPYRNPLWDLAYNEVRIGDGFTEVESLGIYDLVICCDVIEHFDKDTGAVFLAKLLRHGRIVIITSPRGFAPQGAIYNNEHETHRSGWLACDFTDIPHKYKEIGFTFMAVLSADPGRLRPIHILDELRRLGAKRALLEATRLTVKRGGIRIKSLLAGSGA